VHSKGRHKHASEPLKFDGNGGLTVEQKFFSFYFIPANGLEPLKAGREEESVSLFDSPSPSHADTV
jgi:hypothetical protein